MLEREITFDMLSAHVDGELSPTEAAMVGQAAAADPEIAARLAVLLSLRASVAGLVDPVGPGQATGPIETGTAPRRMWNLGRLAFAMTAVLVLAAGSALWFQGTASRAVGPVPQTDAQLQYPALSSMIAAYDAWGDGATIRVVQATPEVEDLSALLVSAGLDRDFTTDFVLPDGAVVQHTGFVGHLGCRLSLFKAALVGAGQGLSISANSDLLLASWTTPAASYVLVARNMNGVRFTTIASVLNAATMMPAQDESQMIALLSGAHQHCIA